MATNDLGILREAFFNNLLGMAKSDNELKDRIGTFFDALRDQEITKESFPIDLQDTFSGIIGKLPKVEGGGMIIAVNNLDDNDAMSIAEDLMSLVDLIDTLHHGDAVARAQKAARRTSVASSKSSSSKSSRKAAKSKSTSKAKAKPAKVKKKAPKRSAKKKARSR